jgi:c-di-GMP-binding flagellar brake protein YcgR
MGHMFASLKHVLRVHRNPARAAVSGRKHIIAVLEQLRARHEVLSVSVAGCRTPSTSAILGVNDSRNCFVLDELRVPETHRAFLQQRKAVVEGRLHGMKLRFACHLLKAETEDGIALYEATIPARLQSVQRRAHFRLPLIPDLDIPVTVPGLQGTPATGQALDLSAGGIGVLLQIRTIPSRGEILPGLSISLPQSRPLTATIEVRFARLDSAHHSLRLGGRFVDLNREQERKLALFLAEQQRKRRRFEPR